MRSNGVFVSAGDDDVRPAISHFMVEVPCDEDDVWEAKAHVLDILCESFQGMSES